MRYLKAVVVASSLCVARVAAAQEEAVTDEADGAPKAAEAPKAEASAAVTTKPEESAQKTEAAVEPPAQTTATPAEKEAKKEEGWSAGIYGFVELDAMRDSTQSYPESAHNNLIARRGTYPGNHGRFQMTAKNSRVGFNFGAPKFGESRATANVELDFFGQIPTDALQNEYNVFPSVRMRHAWAKLETPIVDVLIGQYHDLFGWGGSGFYPASVAFLGLPGQIYHRNPQLRVSKKFGSDAVTLEVAVAAVRPAQRDAGMPDGQAGLRLSLNKWTGAVAQGSGQPSLVPLGLGVSAIGRRLEIPEFRPVPGEPYGKTAWGIAINAVLPVIPVKDVDDRGNGLSINGEFSVGSGVADMYTGLTGGARFPALPNPGALTTAPLWPQNVDNGLATFDKNFAPKTLDWQAFVVGLQYYLPVFGGKVWVTGNFSQAKSKNILELTPAPNRGSVFSKQTYFDANVFVAPLKNFHFALSLQQTQQSYGDGVKAKNQRGQLAALYFF